MKSFTNNFTTKLVLLCLISCALAQNISNCQNQMNGKCVTCQNGFSVNNIGSKCIDNKSKNCAQFLDEEGTQCAVCHCGYSLISTGLCVKAAIKNCAFQDAAGSKCLLCRSTSDGMYGGGITDYGLSSDKKSCIDNVGNKNAQCLQYASGDLMCNSCAQGYLPNAAGTCVQLQTADLWNNNCFTVDDKGLRCLKCKVGYNLDLFDSSYVSSNPCTEDRNYDTNCLRYPLGFDGVTYDFTKCVQCKFGFFLTDSFQCSLINRYTGCTTGNGRAINILNDVVDTADLKKCNQVPGTDFPYLTSDCVLFVEHTYDTSTKVQYCLESKSAKINNNCADLDPLTLQCSSSNACFDGQSYDKDYKTCQDSIVEGCLITSGLGWCEVCLNGYSIREGRCFINPSYNPNCQTWDGVACTACNQGYGDAPSCNGAPSIARCTIMSDGQCVRCANRGYILNETGTECQIQFGGVPYCQEHDADFSCKTCYSTFTLSPDKKSCWQKLKNCSSLSADQVCQTCDRFDHALKLYPDASYSCIKMASAGSYCEITMDGVSCETCQNHPSIAKTANGSGNFLCTASATIIPGCLEFTDASTCKTCEWDYIKTVDNKCYSLTKYMGLYAFQSSVWKELEPCVEAKDVNTCTKCDPKKDAGLLTFAAQSLNALTSQVEMISGGVLCADNRRSHFNTDTTKNNVPNCIAYSDSTNLGVCTTCQTNYSLTAGTLGTSADACTNAFDPNNRCLTMTAAGCTVCRNPSLHSKIIGGQCYAIDELDSVVVQACQTFVTGVTNQCSECHPSHYLDPKDKICKTYSSITDNNLNSICTAKVLDATISDYLCSACSKGYVLKQTSVTANSVTTNYAYCVPDPAQWTSCVKFRTNGFCQTCQTGMKLKGSYDAAKIFSQLCFYEVPNCVQYELATYAYCITCQAPMAPDAYGWACVTEQTGIPRCLAHNRNDITKCSICQSGYAAPDCAGIPFCYETNKDINGNALKTCNICVTGYVKTLTGTCVLQKVPNCEIAVDSFLCAKCKDGYNSVYNAAHDISPYFSTCDLNKTKGCTLANVGGSCIKCIYGEYGLMNGACLKNDGSPYYPLYCAEYIFNFDKKKIQCNLCEAGFGLNFDRTYCIFNNSPCGKQGCYRYETPVAFDSQATCSGDGYANSNILSVFSLLIVLFIAIIN